MLVGYHMTRDPISVGPDDLLADAARSMRAGRFRHLPVVRDGRLVGIVTDRDLRSRGGRWKDARVSGAMTARVITATPKMTLEAAARVLLERKIDALPVVEGETLVGMITLSDVVRALLELLGASEEGTVRIDLVLAAGSDGLSEASERIEAAGGEVLGVGSYREQWDERPVFYVRIRADDPARIADALCESGYEILGVHGPSRDRPDAPAA